MRVVPVKFGNNSVSSLKQLLKTDDRHPMITANGSGELNTQCHCQGKHSKSQILNITRYIHIRNAYTYILI